MNRIRGQGSILIMLHHPDTATRHQYTTNLALTIQWVTLIGPKRCRAVMTALMSGNPKGRVIRSGMIAVSSTDFQVVRTRSHHHVFLFTRRGFGRGSGV